MKLLAFSVYDVKVSGYAHPFFCSAAGEAARLFGDWVNEGKTPLSKHPEDYRLYQVGSFDMDSGAMASLDVPVLVVAGDVVMTRASIASMREAVGRGPKEVVR